MNQNKIDIFDLSSFNPLKDNLVLQASAGTGKTYSVTEIVKKLVFGSNDPINTLRKILIVTYTEKATGELKDRIKSALEENNSLVFSLNDFNIFTIHSFCQNSLKEFGIEANQPIGLNVVDEQTYLDEFVDNYIREKISIEYLESINSQKNISLDTIKSYFISVIKDYYLDFNNKIVDDIVSIEKYDFYSKVLDAKTFDDFLDINQEAKDAIQTLEASSDPKTLDLVSFLRDNYNNGIIKKFGGKFRKSKKWILSDEENEAYDKLMDIASLTSDTKYHVICLVLKYINDLYTNWQQEKLKNKQQTFSDMIRVVRENIISNDSFKNALKNKYTYAIIDEFQDTNQLQFDIFKNIFMDDNNHHIIVVGDPKQSIYSFQGADLNVYEKAKNEIINNGGLLRELDTNWRSTRDMIDACNSVFANPFFGEIDFSNSKYSGCGRELSYKGKPINALQIGTYESDNNYCELTPDEYAKAIIERIVDYCSKDKTGKTNLQIRPKNDKKVVDDKEITIVHDFRNVKFSDFAVLAKAKSEFVPLERLLKRYGVPYIKYKDSDLFLGRECAHWIAIFEAISVPDFTGYNRNIFKKALFTEFFARSLYEINDDYFNKDESLEMELLNRWREIAKNKNWENLIDSILEDSGILERLNSLDKLQTVSLFKQIGDYAISYLYNNHTIEDLIDNLYCLSNGDTDDEDSTKVDVGSDFDAVKLITMHSSKGLQYPIVISVGGYKNLDKSKIKTYLYHNNLKKKCIGFHETQESKIDYINEWKRLIYVAYTRAEYMLMIPYYVVNSNDEYIPQTLNEKTKVFIENKNNKFSIFSSDDIPSKVLKEKINLILNNDSNGDYLKEKESQEDELKKLIREESNKKSYKHAYSSLSHPKDSKNESLDINDPDLINKEGEEIFDISDYDKTNISCTNNLDNTKEPLIIPNKFPKGADIGSALHEVFELATFTDYSLDNFDTNINKLESIINNALKHYKINISIDGINYIKDIVKNVLNAKLTIINNNKLINETIKLSSISDDDKKAEMEFNFNLLNQKFKNYCNGFIDLVFKHGDYYSILDWKSDGLNDDDLLSYSDSESLKNHTDNHYSIQRVLYSYCLIKWLNFNYQEKSLEETFNKHFGGVYYVYIRGCNIDTGNGIYSQTWNSFKDLENAFNFIINDRIGGK